MNALLVGLLIMAAVPLVQAQVIFFDGVNAAIPDGNSSGIADTRNVAVAATTILNLRVTLQVDGLGAGAFNGDFYATLSHGTGFSVLLNRPGTSAANPFGYGDNGFSITFDDGAAAGDVHRYRVGLGLSPDVPLTLPLEGAFAPDGRVVDPSIVRETDPRIALLSSFRGLDPNGIWTLFLADLELGGEAILRSWGLELEGITPIPEPMAWPMPVASALILWRLAKRVLRRN